MKSTLDSSSTVQYGKFSRAQNAFLANPFVSRYVKHLEYVFSFECISEFSLTFFMGALVGELAESARGIVS